MKIFVGYGYQERDQWIEDLVFPIIEAFGSEVISGKEVHGRIISEAIRNEIQKSDALIAFLTRRERTDDGGNTHRWVSDELATALAFKLRVLEVREVGVTGQGGMAGDRQRIEYDKKNRDRCLVELVKAIGQWHRIASVQLQLLPRQFVDEIRPLLRRPGFRCTYNLIEGNNEISDNEANIFPVTGGLFINLKDVSRKALVQVHVEASGKSWTSDFEPIEQFRIHLVEDK